MPTLIAAEQIIFMAVQRPGEMKSREVLACRERPGPEPEPEPELELEPEPEPEPEPWGTFAIVKCARECVCA